MMRRQLFLLLIFAFLLFVDPVSSDDNVELMCTASLTSCRTRFIHAASNDPDQLNQIVGEAKDISILGNNSTFVNRLLDEDGAIDAISDSIISKLVASNLKKISQEVLTNPGFWSNISGVEAVISEIAANKTLLQQFWDNEEFGNAARGQFETSGAQCEECLSSDEDEEITLHDYLRSGNDNRKLYLKLLILSPVITGIFYTILVAAIIFGVFCFFRYKDSKKKKEKKKKSMEKKSEKKKENKK